MAHKSLYQAIEKVITKAVPMWKLALYSTLFQYKKPRIDLQGGGYDHDAAEADYNARYEDGKRIWQREKDERKKEKAQNIDNNDCADEGSSDDDSDDESYCHDDDDFPDPYQDQYVELPDPETYVRRERKTTDEGLAKYEQISADKKLQVIVKLADIHLSPEKPSYDGGSWHIEVSYARGLNHSLSTDSCRACPMSTSLPVHCTTTAASMSLILTSPSGKVSIMSTLTRPGCQVRATHNTVTKLCGRSLAFMARTA